MRIFLRAVREVVILSVMILAFTISNHPSHHPINGVPDADAKGQHDSWPAQGRLSEFAGIDADCENAGYDADDFGEHVRIPQRFFDL